MAQQRFANSFKINSHALYTNPTRTVVPVLQVFIFANNIAIIATGIAFVALASVRDNNGWYNGRLGAVGFLLALLFWVLIPLLLLVCSTASLIYRYRRTTTPKKLQNDAIVTCCSWSAYVILANVQYLIRTHQYFFNLLWLCMAAPGLLFSIVCWVIAYKADRKDKKQNRADGRSGTVRDVQLEEGDSLQAPLANHPPWKWNEGAER